jgi:methionine sulfoxide reductase heme-binding subunit
MPTAGTASAIAGVVSLLLLTASVVVGIAVSGRRRLPWLAVYGSMRLHQNLSLLAIAFLILHIIGAVAMPLGGVGLIGALVPFAARGDRLWIGLGAVAFYLTVALTVTSLLRRRIGRRPWRAVHWLAYACWPAALAHSVETGTGMHSGRLLDLAIVCIAAVVAATAWRLAGGPRGARRSGRAAVPLAGGLGEERQSGRATTSRGGSRVPGPVAASGMDQRSAPGMPGVVARAAGGRNERSQPRDRDDQVPEQPGQSDPVDAVGLQQEPAAAKHQDGHRELGEGATADAPGDAVQ